MRYEIIDAPKQNLISLDYVKNFLRISHNYDDELLEDLVSAAIEAAEHYLRLKLSRATIKIELPFAARNLEIALPLTPVAKIEEVILHDGDKKMSHPFSSKNNMLLLKKMPAHQKIICIYVAGYNQAVDLPANIKRGIMMQVAEAYDNSDSVPLISEAICRNYKSYRKLSL